MLHANVVIGAGFGDEGKGLMTDSLAAEAGADCLVVRFNGGGQAGHTVVTPDGRRHVFNHIGAGTLSGAKTYLTRDFVANPIIFFRELARLEPLGVIPDVSIASSARVTTPWDMMINELIEEARGTGRHGSVGVGFGETIERCLEPDYATYVSDLNAPDLKDKLNMIRRIWVPTRLARLGYPGLETGSADIILSDDLLDRFVEDARAFVSRVNIAGTAMIRRAKHVVFEGAQGLLLDQERGWFPYVTRSHTGIRNAVKIASEAGIDALTVTYCTRAYLTRHGAGPLPGELSAPPYEAIDDSTNIWNPWQQNLRFAHLNLELLRRSIHTDLGDAPPSMAITPRLAITCLDQIDKKAEWVRDKRKTKGSATALAFSAREATGLRTGANSWGPTRQTIDQIGDTAQQAKISRLLKTPKNQAAQIG